jgi:hypothetical protein
MKEYGMAGEVMITKKIYKFEKTHNKMLHTIKIL